MANPQPTDAHIRIAHRIQEEIGMREFTKRQRKILDFILRLSWGCGKKRAFIPKQKYFTLYGIPEQDIKRELRWLAAANVIEIDEEDKTYWFNKNYEIWKVSIVGGYDYEMFKEILHLNIETSQNTKNELRETRRNDFVKHEEEDGCNEVISTPGEVSKESIKENIKYDKEEKGVVPSSTVDYSSKSAVSNDDQFKAVIKHFQNNIYPMIGGTERDFWIDWLSIMEPGAAILAMDEAAKHNVRTLKYIERILMDWQRKGVKTKLQAEAAIREWEERKVSSSKSNQQQAKPFKTFNNHASRDYDTKLLKENLLKKSRGELG